MKHIVFLIAFSLLFSFQSSATHLKGGEISWKCLPNGQYQFYMKVYRECARATFFFNNQTLSSNSPLSSITLKPDSVEYLRLNGGQFAHVNSLGERYDCNNNPQKGVAQAFSFKSDPVSLNGIPPANGWEFYWSLCCRPHADNLANPTSESYYIRATMYAFKNQNANTCFDSSPHFTDYPATVIGVGTPYSFSSNASDDDLDSLVYAFDHPLKAKNLPVNWKPDYTNSSPLPNNNQHPHNIAVKLNASNGHSNGLIISPSSHSEFTYCIRVDSYREGVKIASIWRDMVVMTLPIQDQLLNTSVKNEPPKISLNGKVTNSIKMNVNVGEKISIPVEAKDTNMVLDDPNDPNSLRKQDVLLTATSLLFSKTYSDSSNCNLPSLSSCATLTPAPAYDSTTNTVGFIAPESVATLFEWQANCELLESWENQKTFDFVFSAVDDHFPTLVNYATLSIEVNRKTTEIIHKGKYLTVNDTGHSYQWFRNDTLIPNSDTSSILADPSGMYSVLINGNTSCGYQKAFKEVKGCYGITDSVFSCNSYTWIDGITYSKSTNTPKFILPSSTACDSIVYLHLTIPEIELSIEREHNSFQASQQNAVYQWLECDNSFAAIPGETNQSFSPSKNGIYACEIKMDGCTDTTFCKSFFFIGLDEHFAERVSIFPNPSNGMLNVELLDEINGAIELKMMDINGREVKVKSMRSNNLINIDAQDLDKGVYFLNVRSRDEQANFKWIKL